MGGRLAATAGVTKPQGRTHKGLTKSVKKGGKKRRKPRKKRKAGLKETLTPTARQKGTRGGKTHMHWPRNGKMLRKGGVNLDGQRYGVRRAKRSRDNSPAPRYTLAGRGFTSLRTRKIQ